MDQNKGVYLREWRSRVWIRSHCYLRDEERTFRLDRIISASERGSTKKAIEAADYVTFDES